MCLFGAEIANDDTSPNARTLRDGRDLLNLVVRGLVELQYGACEVAQRRANCREAGEPVERQGRRVRLPWR